MSQVGFQKYPMSYRILNSPVLRPDIVCQFRKSPCRGVEFKGQEPRVWKGFQGDSSAGWKFVLLIMVPSRPAALITSLHHLYLSDHRWWQPSALIAPRISCPVNTLSSRPCTPRKRPRTHAHVPGTRRTNEKAPI